MHVFTQTGPKCRQAELTRLQYKKVYRERRACLCTPSCNVSCSVEPRARELGACHPAMVHKHTLAMYHYTIAGKRKLKGFLLIHAPVPVVQRISS